MNDEDNRPAVAVPVQGPVGRPVPERLGARIRRALRRLLCTHPKGRLVAIEMEGTEVHKCSACGTRFDDNTAPHKQQEPSNAFVYTLHQGEVSRKTAVSVEAMDEAICVAVNAAKDANVPQGLIVALLHAHATRQTAELI